MINFESDLNKNQLKAVTFSDGPLLILAGAGSGKTRALTYRAAHLIQEKKIDPNSILLLTFTNKAASEMQERLKKLVGVSLPFAGTFHSFCAKLLRRDGVHLGIPPGYLIYDDTDQIDLLKQIIKKLELPKTITPRGAQSQIGGAKNELLSPADYAQISHGFFQQQVAEVYRDYQHTLEQNHALDFDDLLLKTVKLLQEVPHILAKYQQQFHHVLIDEYQDTNRAQYLLARLISSRHNNLTVVGDASQSIYRWRGADYRNLDYLNHDYPDLTTIKLEQNYRSTQPILDASYAIIQNNKSHPILSLWTDQKVGEPLKLFEAESEKDEARFIVGNVQLSPITRSSAVLYRTNAQSRALEEACIRSGLPYTLVGGIKFYERKEIKDLLAYLRLLINPIDPVSLDRAIKIGKRRLQAFQVKSKNINIETTTASEIFDQVLAITGYLDKYNSKNEADLERIENIKELASVSTQFETLGDFLENVALVEKNTLSKTHQVSPTKPHLTLMTVHSSKGLEFDQIFVVGLEEGIFPHSRSLLEPAELEEERRLCYVALTRAKTHLYLTYARNRLFFGGRSSGIVSRFISEIPEHLLEPVNRYQTPYNNTKLNTFDDDLIDRFLDDEIDIDELIAR